jgi:hypothetical protein
MATPLWLAGRTSICRINNGNLSVQGQTPTMEIVQLHERRFRLSQELRPFLLRRAETRRGGRVAGRLGDASDSGAKKGRCKGSLKTPILAMRRT